ncbi:MAG: Si-specific NAD(P)(+) transhydrogenase [Nitrospirota bacterium]|nr:Si-specific NAD(P)(+) transhydrogenase [Nitrospirota bacterium]
MMNADFDYDLICIGSGPAGQRGAIQAAKLGKKVAVIEKRRCVGGVCLETGTIPSKTFREAINTFVSHQQQSKGLGFTPRTKVDITTLLSRVNRVIQEESEIQQDQLQRNDVNIILGTATFKNAHKIEVKTDEGIQTLSSKYFLIAVGTQPSVPKGIQLDNETIILSDGILDLNSLPRTMAVVGAGVVGMEYATMFAALGIQVTVIDKRDKPLGFLDHEIIDELMYQMRDKRGTFRLGEEVTHLGIIENGKKKQGLIQLESGKHIIADLILYSAGRVGAIEQLKLKQAGLKADSRGRLKVDNNYRTSLKHIYAAGDVIGFPSLAATSATQGRLAACHMFGVKSKPMGEYFPFGIYSIPEISMVGATEEELTRAKIPYETGIARYREIARGQIMGDNTGLLKIIVHRETEKLLGVHAIGTGVTELIHVGQAVMQLNGKLDYFMQTVFNYPTLAECYKVAALNVSNKLQYSTLAKAIAV